MKTFLRLVGGLVILVALVAFAFFFYLDHIARAGIERGGSHALGVPTTLEAADVRPLAGAFEMKGLVVANPAGFDHPHFLRLNEGRSSVRLKSLMEETVDLPALTLGGLDVYLEGHGDGANYDVIIANLKRFEDPGSPSGADEGGKRFIIRKIDLQDITVHIDMPIGGKQTRVDAPIGKIELSNVGSDSDTGVLMAELTNIIVKAVMSAIIEQGGLPTEVLAGLEQGLARLQPLADAGVGMAVTAVEGIRDTVTEGIDQAGAKLGESVGEIGEGVAEEADKAIKGIGDLLGGNEKDDQN